MNPQLLQVESRPYTKLESASQILPESSSTNTKSMLEVPPEHTVGDGAEETNNNMLWDHTLKH